MDLLAQMRQSQLVISLIFIGCASAIGKLASVAAWICPIAIVVG